MILVVVETTNSRAGDVAHAPESLPVRRIFRAASNDSLRVYFSR